MKFHGIGVPMLKTKSVSNGPKVVVLTAITLVILTLIPIYYPLPGYLTIPWISSSSHKSLPATPLSAVEHDDSQVVASEKQCDIFTGEWVPNPQAPYYTNLTCWAIHEHQNCMKYGRPDSDFMKWRWKPDECELPIFNPYQFLEILRGKSMAFVGDSVARNQMQSLMCLLSRVTYPVDVSYSKEDGFKRWHYPVYNYTLATFLTPYLVRAEQSEAKGPTGSGLFNLYLDEFNEDWRTQIESFDYVLISAGHWFQRPMMFYEKGQLVGCHYCLKENVTDLNMFYGYRKAFRTAFKAIRSLPNFKGITYLRTVAPSHFEKGVWNQGGDCVRTKPFRSNESHLEGRELEYYRIQLEEFRIAEKEGKKIGQKYRLLDTTQATYLRPDGHPSRYGHWPNENVTLYNDCVHWCLPGPIDAWNDFLLHMMKMENYQGSQASQQ